MAARAPPRRDPRADAAPSRAPAHPTPPRVTLTGQQAQPWDEFLEEVDNIARLKLGRTSDALERTDVVESDWAFGQRGEQSTFIVARDHAANLPTTLRRWLELSTGLVQIVVAPYRLREQFVAELSDHLDNRRRFSALAPGYSRSRWRQVYALYRRLERDFVSFRLVTETLSDIDVAGDVAEQLRALFREWLELETRFETRRVLRYRESSGSLGSFAVDTELRIRPERRDTRPHWHQVVAVRTVEKDGRSRKTVARYYRGEVQQQLLPGQVHAFGGQPYRIEPYRADDDTITAYWVNLRDARTHYEQVRRYELDWAEAVLEPSYQPIRLNGTRGRLERVELPITATTLGYTASLDTSNDPSDDYRPLPTPLTRHYRHGKMLALYTDNPLTDSARRHLAILLNDAFVSYYPEAHPFLRATVTSSVDKDAVDRESDKAGAPPSLLPLVTHHNIDRPPDLCLIADTPFDLGLVESLEENLAMVLDELTEAAGVLAD